MTDWIREEARKIKDAERLAAEQSTQVKDRAVIAETWRPFWSEGTKVIQASVSAFNEEWPSDPDRHMTIEIIDEASLSVTRPSDPVRVLKVRASEGGIGGEQIRTTWPTGEQQKRVMVVMPFEVSGGRVSGARFGTRVMNSAPEVAAQILRTLF